jgi:N,N-dimethylformamidase
MRATRLTCLVIAVAGLAASPAHAQNPKGMRVVGYADRLSVQQGETIRFMVSSELPRYRADIVRLIHGDTNPRGPGVKEQVVETPVNKEYAGTFQRLPNGSYVVINDAPPLRLTGSFTLQAWVQPTLPGRGVQAILSKYSAADRSGYALVVDEDGSLGLFVGAAGRVERVRTGRPFPMWKRMERPNPAREAQHTSQWYFVAATFDASSGKVTLYQQPVTEFPGDVSGATLEHAIAARPPAQNTYPFLIAALWEHRAAESGLTGGHFNGKIEGPRVFDRALTAQEIASLREGAAPKDPVAAWDFSAGISLSRVTDASANGLHGEAVNMPTRGVTGHRFSGSASHYKDAPAEYAAIHFHDDDLDDAKWEVGFEFQVPADLRSGIYAARLRAGNGEDYIPFYVRPRTGGATAPIAFLVPTFSYLAYANSGMGVPQLLSCYDHHTDGSGVAYSSRLRPILNMRPKISMTWGDLTFPHQLNADLHLIDWLEAKKFQYDVITDEDLHWEGASLLKPYKAVLTGSHPEYWSGQMLDGLETYLRAGGRTMYLGGNGFYWVTNIDPQKRHTVEIRRWGGTQAWEALPGEFHLSTTGELGGLWRFRDRAPQRLVGVGFTAQGSARGVPYERQPASYDPRVAWIFEGIGPDEKIGDHPSLVMDHGAAGFEVDRADFGLGTPPTALILATAAGLPTCAGLPCPKYVHVIEEVWSNNSGPYEPLQKADMVFIEYPNGGAVFSVGSISWDGSLSYNDYNNTVSRVTDNVLRRFSANGPVIRTTRPTEQ